MTQDSGGMVGYRDRFASGVLVRRNPAHDPESADKVDVGRLHPVKTKIVKIHPIAGVLVAAEVQFPHRAGFRLWDRQYYATRVIRAAPKGSSPLSCMTSRLARASAFKFCVCIAMLLMRNTGRPCSSVP